MQFDKIKNYLIIFFITILVIIVARIIIVRFAIFKEMVDHFDGAKPALAATESKLEPESPKAETPPKNDKEPLKYLYIIKSKLQTNLNYENELEELRPYLQQSEFEIISKYALSKPNLKEIAQIIEAKIKNLIISDRCKNINNEILARVFAIFYKNIFLTKTKSDYHFLIESLQHNNLHNFLSIYDSLGEETKKLLSDEYQIISSFLEASTILDRKFIQLVEGNNA
jgi:hypothetical protein